MFGLSDLLVIIVIIIVVVIIIIIIVLIWRIEFGPVHLCICFARVVGLPQSVCQRVSSKLCKKDTYCQEGSISYSTRPEPEAEREKIINGEITFSNIVARRSRKPIRTIRASSLLQYVQVVPSSSKRVETIGARRCGNWRRKLTTCNGT